MSKLERLEKLKKQIIDKLITEKSIEKAKDKEMLKNGFFKQFFKYAFLKPLFNNKTNSSVDKFFITNEFNCLKGLIWGGFIPLMVMGVIGALTNETVVSILISLSGSLLLVFFIMAILGVSWMIDNSKTKKDFDIKNIEKTKENLFENYSDHQIKNLLNEKLDKKELTSIMKEIEGSIGEEYFLAVFNNLKLYKEGTDISDPYVLLSVINEIIKCQKDIDYQNKEIDKNKKIMKLLLKEENQIRENINI